jgi:methylthioribose-1-phosphate isomerase
LTAWELVNHGVPHTVITDNTGGHLMQHGMVDMVITGADRVTRCGDAANKIGTYLKALAAHDNNIPFFIALPSSTFDWKSRDGVKEVNIEERNADEVKYVYGLCDGNLKKVLITPKESNVVNYGFDVTPARLITALITERGICKANEKDILNMFPEHKETV